MKRRETPSEITAGSVVKALRITDGKTWNAMALHAMKPVPKSSAVQPARAAPRGSPRPTACPTRTAPAEDTPRGTMKVPWCTTPIEAESSLGPDSHHPIISLSGIPSAVMVFRILHPIFASTLCAANPLARIAEPTIAL